MKIGVFDSGKGGFLIAERLRELLPSHEFIVAHDSRHVPYGTRPASEILTLTDAALQPLLRECPVIVIACNTITTSVIHTLRERYPDTGFVGLEPMVKPASQLTRSGRLLILATPATLSSARYDILKRTHAGHAVIDEPSTGHWPRLIEDGHTETIDLSDVAASYHDGVDVVVLGCTHYLALIPRLKLMSDDVVILEPSAAIARRVQQLVDEVRQPTSIDRYG
jgi:glutamate racemase